MAEQQVHMRVWRGDASGGEFKDYRIAVGEGQVVLDVIHAIIAIEGVHFQRRQAHEEARAGEGRLIVVVVADNMADVLAQETLDTFVEFLYPVDVFLVHPAGTVGFFRFRLERRNFFGFLIVV